MGPAIVSQPDGPRTDALVEAEGDREAIHWRRPSFNLSWGQWAHLDTNTRRGSAKRNAAFTLQHGAMLTSRQPEGCVPAVVLDAALVSRPGSFFLPGFLRPGKLRAKSNPPAMKTTSVHSSRTCALDNSTIDRRR